MNKLIILFSVISANTPCNIGLGTSTCSVPISLKMSPDFATGRIGTSVYRIWIMCLTLKRYTLSGT